MVKLTQSLSHWLFVNHPKKLPLIMLGHLELFTDEMQKDYLEWCKTEEGKSYLVGGSNYREGGLELSGKGTPIEFANAVINLFLGDVNDLELADLRKRELGEIAEHIQVFLKYSERNY